MIEILLHPITKMPKRCFPSPDGTYTLCNFTTKNGEIWRYAVKVMYLTIPRKQRSNREEEEKLIKKKNESLLKGDS